MNKFINFFKPGFYYFISNWRLKIPISIFFAVSAFWFTESNIIDSIIIGVSISQGIMYPGVKKENEKE